ncbi:hypothetical protein OOU_Y34scaffold00979g40 [Pyricularia oryzae Y34]|uniref:Uncharacterized protein n=2 Tax=Pyricularia oryzae TaxID=318829 RepID=A0AA97PG27_PYRO3|nr:hypothetical protein OOU_Y34scaffold00979g40 [Pyricularia oryzae Y34]
MDGTGTRWACTEQASGKVGRDGREAWPCWRGMGVCTYLVGLDGYFTWYSLFERTWEYCKCTFKVPKVPARRPASSAGSPRRCMAMPPCKRVPVARRVTVAQFPGVSRVDRKKRTRARAPNATSDQRGQLGFRGESHGQPPQNRASRGPPLSGRLEGRTAKSATGKYPSGRVRGVGGCVQSTRPPTFLVEAKWRHSITTPDAHRFLNFRTAAVAAQPLSAHDKCDLGQGAASKVGKQGFNHVLVRQRESDKPTAFYSAFLLVARYGPTPEPPHKNTLNARDGKRERKTQPVTSRVARVRFQFVFVQSQADTDTSGLRILIGQTPKGLGHVCGHQSPACRAGARNFIRITQGDLPGRVGFPPGASQSRRQSRSKSTFGP